MPPPVFARLREIVSLVGAAALGASEGGPGNALGDETHVAQVVPVDPLRIEAGLRGAEPLAFRAEGRDVLQSALKPCARAQGADVLAHDRLEACDLGCGVDPGNGGR